MNSVKLLAFQQIGRFGQQIAQEANDLLGGKNSVLIFDKSGFAKKGEASAGISRQWNGRLGKVDNCQVGVFATLCRGDLATLIDTRLYLPKAWCNDEARCRKAAIPKDQRHFRMRMPNYQVLRWDAWHHHMALGMLGTLFLVKQKTVGRQPWPMLSFNELVTAQEHLLSRRQLTADELADIIGKRHDLETKGHGISRQTVSDGAGMHLTK